jgi:hypothetical protein
MIITVCSIITHFVNWYNNWLQLLMRHFSLVQKELTSLWILDGNVSPPAWISFTIHHYLAIYTSSTLQQQFQHPKDYNQELISQLYIFLYDKHHWTYKKKNSMVWVHQRTIPTERLPLVGEVITKFADRGCYVVSVTDPYGRILGFLDRSRYFSIK